MKKKNNKKLFIILAIVLLIVTLTVVFVVRSNTNKRELNRFDHFPDHFEKVILTMV